MESLVKPNLEALWEAHCEAEFERRDVPATMRTMVAQPYVNHIPTMTGGVGQARKLMDKTLPSNELLTRA